MIGKTSSAGILLPPPNFPDPRPLYYIAVCNSFIWPNCLITSLFRGSSPEGHYVGGFSTILSVYPHRTDSQTFTNLQTVTLGSKEVPTAQLFELSETSHAVVRAAIFYLSHHTHLQSWNVSTSSDGGYKSQATPLYGNAPIGHWLGRAQSSHLLAPKVTIAHYAPNKRLTNMLATHPPPEPLLTITPQGHKHIDDIVLSLLVMERERLAFANRIATY
ncbi:hypothetical protein BJ165DRAFT_1566076 [Panaeolus papilionaceus]|nr:hypothetical protein BJ165DRAFT_1566076 [Panaeolus papilionaceus]